MAKITGWKHRRYSDERASQLGSELEGIRAEHGHLSTDLVWQEAKRSPGAVLHGEYTWDLEEAARYCWREQTRSLMRSISVIVEDGDSEREMRAYYNVVVEVEDVGSVSGQTVRVNRWEHVSVISRDEQKRQYVMDRAGKALVHFKRVLEDLDVLPRVRGQVEELELAFERMREAEMAGVAG